MRSHVPVILLGAGKAERMGAQKLDLPLPLPGDPQARLGAHALAAALSARIGPVWVVLADEGDALWLNPFHAAVTDGRVRIVRAKEAGLGQAHSLRAGIAAVRLVSDVAVIALADQPFVPGWVFKRMARVYKEALRRAKAPSAVGLKPSADADDAGRLALGPPLLLGPDVLARAEQLTGDEGARKILKDPAVASRMAMVSVSDPWIFFDVDRPEDYDCAKSHVQSL